jgi:hypothetical protein
MALCMALHAACMARWSIFFLLVPPLLHWCCAYFCMALHAACMARWGSVFGRVLLSAR